jgi:hypothetical protein
MNIQTKSQTQGSVLLVALLTATVIGISLSSYLTLTSNQHLAVFRSSSWSECIPVAEAGIEEAMTQINSTAITKLWANNWTWGTDRYYHKTHSVGNDGSYYEVAINPIDPPVIVSTAYVRAPLVPTSAFGMILGSVSSARTPNPSVKRRVQVNTIRSSSFNGAMVAKGTIDFSGQNVTTDSFDSSDPKHSTNGKWDAANAKAGGDVRTNARDGKVAAIDVGNADIKGHVATGPLGVVTVGSGGSVGDLAWVNGGKQGIQPGYSAGDSNIEILDVQEPFSGGYFTPIGGTVGGITYDYILDQSGNNKLSSFGGNVLVTGNATLWVTDSVSFAGMGSIEIKPGASLTLYVSAPTATIGGHGIINGNGSASSFQYYGLPSNTSLKLTGNASFTGTVYAPQAAFSLGGGGADPHGFVGACVVNTVKMNGHFNFHYDEALRKLIRGPYVPCSWDELDPS